MVEAIVTSMVSVFGSRPQRVESFRSPFSRIWRKISIQVELSGTLGSRGMSFMHRTWPHAPLDRSYRHMPSAPGDRSVMECEHLEFPRLRGNHGGDLGMLIFRP
ncbi:hypothetical protein B296_00028285 [Ensete ventricosum]|uniref:Uncharacterized protein n=1 Tax=Ensete ventricosum TaxID=4639 RepID=A0A426ZMX5_ENSVE|nr:hypothetical protein B296_00028285 [Ensete ventricosum]